jgi:hypothetical protein
MESSLVCNLCFLFRIYRKITQPVKFEKRKKADNRPRVGFRPLACPEFSLLSPGFFFIFLHKMTISFKNLSLSNTWKDQMVYRGEEKVYLGMGRTGLYADYEPDCCFQLG